MRPNSLRRNRDEGTALVRGNDTGDRASHRDALGPYGQQKKPEGETLGLSFDA